MILQMKFCQASTTWHYPKLLSPLKYPCLAHKCSPSLFIPLGMPPILLVWNSTRIISVCATGRGQLDFWCDVPKASSLNPQPAERSFAWSFHFYLVWVLTSIPTGAVGKHSVGRLQVLRDCRHGRLKGGAH